ncbi:MAG: hypothetical protein WKG07_38645 [Hymenobacter sp.]
MTPLRRRGYQLRWLAAGLPPSRPPSGGLTSLGQAVQFKGETGFYWERIRQAADSFPGQPLYAVTPAALGGIGGPHPALPVHLTWQTIPSRAAAEWLQAAAVSADSLRLLLGRSDERQTTFRTVRVARPRPGALLTGAALPPALRNAGRAAAARFPRFYPNNSSGGASAGWAAARAGVC